MLVHEPEAVIVFSHFRDDEVTRHHLDLLRRHNPFPVVPVHRSVEHMPGSIRIDQDRYWADEPLWSGSDCILYQFPLVGGMRAKRYVWLEWDTYCDAPLRDYYGDAWDAPVACTDSFTFEENPSWYWFGLSDNLGPELMPHRAGLVPLNGVMTSYETTMTLVRNRIRPRHVHCELRLASLLKYYGVSIAKAGGVGVNTFSALDGPGAAPGLYHPVKSTRQSSTDLPAMAS